MGPNQSKPCASCSPEIDLIDLHSLRYYSKYLMTDHRQRRVRKGGNTEIHPGELMSSWIYDEKFLVGMQFLFRTRPFTVGEDDNLERPTQELEEGLMTMIDLEKNKNKNKKSSVTMLQAAIRQPASTNLIDSLA
jgi:hypothetical protein